MADEPDGVRHSETPASGCAALPNRGIQRREQRVVHQQTGPVNRLSRLDFPALVYPAITTEDRPRRAGAMPSTTARDPGCATVSRSRVICARIRRRSVSIFVSPRPPGSDAMPLLAQRLSPAAQSRQHVFHLGQRDLRLASLLRACWANMSRINHVLSTTLTCTMASSLRN